MYQYTAAQGVIPKNLQPEKGPAPYSSVEISDQEFSFCYQFKLWNMAPKDVCILVKEDSQILPQLRKGDTLNMKYYLDEEPCSVESHKTAIRNVTKDDQGRFKGHYVVQLEILDH